MGTPGQKARKVPTLHGEEASHTDGWREEH